MKEKKPDPSIYLTAAKVNNLHPNLTFVNVNIHNFYHHCEFLNTKTPPACVSQRLGISASDCLVVEDSVIGLQVSYCFIIVISCLIFVNILHV